jgi:hypothetical protein
MMNKPSASPATCLRGASILCVASTILLALNASAGDLPAEEPARTAGYQIKSRSAFNAPDTARPPFWPIGWSREAKLEARPAAVQPQIEPAMFSVTSILLGNPSLAVINGRAYGEGDTIRPAKAAAKRADAAPAPAPASKNQPPQGVRVRVARIFDGGVQLATDAQTVTVALRRPELSERPASTDEELLLNVDDR